MTLRAHIYIVNTKHLLGALALVALFGHGCSSATGPKPVTSKEPEKGLEFVKLDVARRGRPDTWRWLKKGQNGQPSEIVREEVDLNGDGKVDFQKKFAQGKPLLFTLDLDFDGRNDLIEHYIDGALVRIESSHNFSGKMDTWRFFEKGALARVERDTNGDGKPDEWMYYAQDKLQRTARDLNYDGVVDTWEE